MSISISSCSRERRTRIPCCSSGRIRRIDEDAIHRQLDSGAIVLMGPVAVSVTGESFNLTSEEIAT
ncbi:hypothetical protein ACSLPA_28705, partial [Escherichia coli]